MPNARRPLRVALIAATLGQGGAEKQLLYVARALQQAGVDVRVYSLNKGEFYEPAFKNMGLTPIWIGRFNNPLIRLARLISEVRRFKPHFVQSSHLYANLYAAFAARATGAISVGAIRGSLRYSTETNGHWTRWLVRATSILITNSRATQTELSKSGLIETQRIRLIPNTIDLADFDDAFVQRSNGDVTAIFLGRLIPIKRLDNFLHALALARKSHPKLRGVVVGDGPERAKWERLAVELNLEQSGVTFLGSQDDVRSLLAQADLLVLSSLDEGFPNVVLEAMAARLPVVTTPAGDAGFVVENGISGYVVPFDDIKQMSESMLVLAKSPALRRKMGDAGRRRVQELYGFEHFADKLLSTYSAIAPRG
jgi:glycosyltransferase involved in cell wall biosynthesis